MFSFQSFRWKSLKATRPTKEQISHRKTKRNISQKFRAKKPSKMSFKDEIIFWTVRKDIPTNKTVVREIDDTWNTFLLDNFDYADENNKSFRYVLLVINNFAKFGLELALKTEIAVKLTKTFIHVNKHSHGKLDLKESDDEKTSYGNCCIVCLVYCCIVLAV